LVTSISGTSYTREDNLQLSRKTIIMPRYILKPEQDSNFYVEWSTIVDSPLSWGSIEDLGITVTPEIKDRIDQTGTSSFHGVDGWDSPALLVRELGTGHGSWELPRQNLRSFLEELESVATDNAGQDKVLAKYATAL
jgi:hypothetical protein